MRKQKLLLLAVMCALVFTGCKKKDSVDLSSLHTTAAIEKETIPETSETATTAPVEESTASEDKEPAGVFSVKTDMKSHTLKNTTIEYPEISGMKDSEKQKQVNEVLKRNALAIMDVYPLKDDSQSLSVKATVESANLKRITVTYKGELKASGAAKNTRIFYANTVDLGTAENLRLSDYADAYTVAGYITSGDYKLESTSGADEAAIRADINAADKTTDYYYKKLGAADFAGGYTEEKGDSYTADTWPELFSYEKQGVVYLSIPLKSELGNYAVIKYSPDNK